MTYYLTMTARRKNARRHIGGKFKTIQDAMSSRLWDHPTYDIALYDANWNLVAKERKIDHEA